MIVNYYESVQLVTRLKAELEKLASTSLRCSCNHPGFEKFKNINVLEGAGFEVSIS